MIEHFNFVVTVYFLSGKSEVFENVCRPDSLCEVLAFTNKEGACWSFPLNAIAGYCSQECDKDSRTKDEPPYPSLDKKYL